MSHSIIPLPAGLTLERTLLVGPGPGYPFKINGTSYHRDTIEFLRQEVGHHVHAILLPEPSNPYDSSAVVVTVPFEGELREIGHLPKKIAADCVKVLQKVVDQGVLPMVNAHLASWDIPFVEISLLVPWGIEERLRSV